MGSKLRNFYKNRGRTGQLKNDPDKPQAKWQKDHVVENHVYPSDLFKEDKPLGPYVIFYINVFDPSKAVTKGNLQFVENNDAIQKERRNGVIKRMAEQGYTNPTAVKGAVVGGAVTGGGLIGGLLKGQMTVDAKSAGLGLAVGLTAIQALESQGVTFNKSQKRLRQAIAMHMPNDIQISYTTSYSPENMSDFALASKIGSSVVGLANGAIDLAKNSVNIKEIVGATGQTMFAPTLDINGLATGASKAFNRVTEDIKSYSAPAAAAALKYLPYGDAISAISGIAANPKTQLTFQGVTPRSFEMVYDLYARSEEELENIHRIINTFKMNMLPEYKGNEEFLFVYPAEFDIEYYFGAENNKYIHKHTSCVLTDCVINYTPDGTFNFFNKNGAPLRIRMSLRFTELEILTRDDIQDGGGGF